MVRLRPNGLVIVRSKSWIPQLRLGNCFSRSAHFLKTTDSTKSASAAEGIRAGPPDSVDTFSPGGADYFDELYHSWKKDPSSVHISWRSYFQSMKADAAPTADALQTPNEFPAGRQYPMKSSTSGLNSLQSQELEDYQKVRNIIQDFQKYGHRKAMVDPLVATKAVLDLPNLATLDAYGINASDLDRKVYLHSGILPGLASDESSDLNFRDIIIHLSRMYCGSMGAEIEHVSDPVKKAWLRTRFEEHLTKVLSVSEKGRVLDTIMWVTITEQFLAAKFPNEKRFGLDGAESLAAGVSSFIDQSRDAHEINNIVVGSCHRGRMNLISNVYGGDHETLFRHFAGTLEPDIANGQSGDVKYHQGVEGNYTTASGKIVNISLLPNPSHLEAIDPVAQGQAKAMQHSADLSETMLLAIHGDAAFSGQGVVYETLNLAKLKGYAVGGTVRIMINNQIGFTTDAMDSRSTPYCTDLAKYIEAPIFHVNSDDPEAVVFLCKLAADYRSRFKSDIVIDFVCYRRFGHNEIDQASFTQPEMYEQIARQQPVLEKYCETLVADGSFSQSEIEERKRLVWGQLEERLAQSKNLTKPADSAIDMVDSLKSESPARQTAVKETTLTAVMEKISSVPEGFFPHSSLQRILKSQRKDFDAGHIGWSTAEALAFGSLLLEGHDVRLTGQDVQRGTFSQRHSVLHDQKTHIKWTPLNTLADTQGTYSVFNSPLSEFAVLGFEYGYSLASPNSLILWEAQFGDFANNAQVIIDQFIASGEAKWLLRSGLVLSLPHGYDGQGPEHSSARIGRFLELCNEDPTAWFQNLESQRKNCNMQVVYMTTPANLFHVLRRQIKLQNRKPLIIFFSKSLLRHPLARSSLQDLSDTAGFQPVLEDPSQPVPDSEIEKVVLCSGQVFAALHEHREKQEDSNAAITRIEELHPFPYTNVLENLNRYPQAKEIVWCQEEPYNSGMWHYVRDRLEQVVQRSECHKATKIRYAGRPPGAVTASGSKRIHTEETRSLLKSAFQ